MSSVAGFAVAEWLHRQAEQFQQRGQTDEADALQTALMAICAVYEVDPADKVRVCVRPHR